MSEDMRDIFSLESTGLSYSSLDSRLCFQILAGFMVNTNVSENMLPPSGRQHRGDYLTSLCQCHSPT
jgi:hypothetical protein